MWSIDTPWFDVTVVMSVWVYSVLALLLIGVLNVHLVWLPKHGINGWTAEPYDKYLELMRSRSRS